MWFRPPSKPSALRDKDTHIHTFPRGSFSICCFFLPTSFILTDKSFNSDVSVFISVALDKNPLCLFTLPPDIEPPAFNISPSSVTTLNLYPKYRLIAMALSTLSTTTTLPSKLFIIPSYLLLYFISLLPSPIKPFCLLISPTLSSSLPFTADTGKNVARPALFLRR